MQHRIKVLQLDQEKFAGSCSCGWVGPDKKERIQASIDANRHIADQARLVSKK